MGDMDRAIREALYCHEMFEPYQHSRFGLDHLMAMEATWGFTLEHIQDALAKLQREELVDVQDGFWFATTAGRIARERTWQQKGYRHPALSRVEADAKDVILALIRSGGEDSEELAHPNLEERMLAIYLPDVPNDTKQAMLQELATDGLIRRGMAFHSRNEPEVTLTSSGLRVYAQQVVGRLGLKPPATILAAQEVQTLPFDELGLPKPLADNLRYRWEEAERCIGACAWLGANILFGSILEVVLPAWLARVSTRALAAQTAPRGKRQLERWTLSECIDVATELQLIDPALTQYATALRFTRNLVHPELQMREQSHPDSGLTVISKHVVLAILEAVARSTP